MKLDDLLEERNIVIDKARSIDEEIKKTIKSYRKFFKGRQKEYYILYNRYVMGMTLEEVGRKFDVTRERIRQLEAKTFTRLRVILDDQ